MLARGCDFRSDVQLPNKLFQNESLGGDGCDVPAAGGAGPLVQVPQARGRRGRAQSLAGMCYVYKQAIIA